MKQNKTESVIEGGKLSGTDITKLLDKYKAKGLEEDPEHGEYFKIGNTRIQKLQTIGRVGMVNGVGGKPKPIEVRIEELLGMREEKW
ncbi:MAG: hypothetical protein Q8R36_04325 [bacterium]|nr:hypothetical protein [bacterium]